MSISRKLSKVLLCLFLGFSSMSGVPMDPKQIEDLLHLMNETKVEVVVPEHNGKDDPELPVQFDLPWEGQESDFDACQGFPEQTR
jgi:hypothetical protein